MTGDDLVPAAELAAELDTVATDPFELIGDLAGTNRVTRDLLLFAWGHRHVTDSAGFPWVRMLAHIPEGVRGAVDLFFDLLEYLRRWEQPHNVAVDMKLRYGIVEMLWRLQHPGQPCISSIAVADSVDDIHPCDGLLCNDCRRAA